MNLLTPDFAVASAALTAPSKSTFWVLSAPPAPAPAAQMTVFGFVDWIVLTKSSTVVSSML